MCIVEPYVRALFGDCTGTTMKTEKTLTPLWDETLVFHDVLLFGDIRESALQLKLELYDLDTSAVLCFHTHIPSLSVVCDACCALH